MKKLPSIFVITLFLTACADVYEVAYAPSVALQNAQAEGYAKAVAAQVSPDERKAMFFQQCTTSMTSEDLQTLKRRGDTVTDACSCIVETFDKSANQTVWEAALIGNRHKDFGTVSKLYEYSIQSCGLKIT